MISQMLRVTEVRPLSSLICRFRFVHPEGKPLAPFSGGAHVVVEMPDGDVLRRNPYSLISDPLDPDAYEIAVRRDDEGRGGSRYMHSKVRAGDLMRVTAPVNLFSLDLRARKHVLIAGGIGITPFLSQLRQLQRLNAPFELYYAARSRAEAAGLKLLPDLPQIHVLITDEGQSLDLKAIVSRQPLGTHVYTCGPAGLITSVYEVARSMSWPEAALHSEAFLSPPPGRPFEVVLARSKKTITVSPHQSLLEALEAADVDIDWSCRGGACGRCETRVLTCKGTILHNDHWLSEDEHLAQLAMMPCVSRFEGEQLVIDR